MAEKYRFLALMFSAALVIFASGCTGINQGASSGGSGLVIKSFEPDMSSVDSWEPVKLYMLVENTGHAAATDIKTELMGINTNEWRLTPRSNNMEHLAPADPKYNTHGGTGSVSWNLQAPAITGSMKQTYRPKVRVTYAYETTASKLITIVNRDEIRRLVQSGRPLPSGSTTTYTAGPLAVDIAAGSFIKAGVNRFPVTVKITNTGSGSLVSDGGDEYAVDYELTLPAGLSSDCKEGSANLYKGRDYTMTCDVTVTTTPKISEEKNIQLILTYSYFIDAETTITVSGS
jgi:hypothetical protein